MEVEVLIGLGLREGVVEGELVVLDVARDAVHLVVALVHDHERVAGRHAVDFTANQLLLKYRALPHTNGNSQVETGAVALQIIYT